MSLIDEYSKDELEQIVKTSFSYAEVLSKLGYGTSQGGNHKTLKKRIQYYNISTQHFHITASKRDWSDTEIFCEDSKASQSKLRRTFKARNFIEYECAICGLAPFWNGKSLVLTLDHKNGKNKDNRIENLQWVCPNCDRQSNTYCAKSKKQHEKGVILHSGNYDRAYANSVPKEIIEEAFREVSNEEAFKAVKQATKTTIAIPERQELKAQLWTLKNYTQVANFYNVTSTHIRRWCRKYSLPATINIIKHTSEAGWQSENWNDLYKPKVINYESKACNMIDKDTGDVLKTFKSRSEAARYLGLDTKHAVVHIGRTCNGERASAYGYKWSNA